MSGDGQSMSVDAVIPFPKPTPVGMLLPALGTYNVMHGPYNAKGDGRADDWAAIQQAINDCAAAGGGVVSFPPGRFVYTKTLQIPVALNSGQVILRGSGMRVTYLFPSGPAANFTATGLNAVPSPLIFGVAVPDNSGTFTNVTQYQGMEDMSISGTLISNGSVRGVVITEMQYGSFKNIIIETFPNASVGLYLQGSHCTAGLGGAPTAPHVRLCKFENIVVTTIGGANLGGNACILQNADENDFINCSFAVTGGQTVAANSILTAWVKMGRNNRFFGVLYAGDTGGFAAGYAGLVFGPPQNELGVGNGNVSQNQDYGAVAEGFNTCFWVKADASGNTLGNSVINANPSIYTVDWQDDTQPTNPGGFALGGQGGNMFICPMLGRMVAAVREPAAPTAVLANNSLTPSVSGSNAWSAANAAGTIITDFLNGSDGQRITIRFTNGNTTIRDVNNGGGGNIRNYGRQDVVGAANWVVAYQKIAGIWHQVSPVRFEGGQGTVYGAALATTATRGFQYIPSCAGTPTGVPTELPTGTVPMVFDTTGVKLWIFTGGAWKGVVVA